MSPTAVLQHNKARPQTVNKTLETIRDLKMELLEHPPYSLNLVPGDFYMFEPLDVAIRRVHASNDEVKNTMHSCRASKQSFFFSGIITKSVELRTKGIEKGGDYLEK